MGIYQSQQAKEIDGQDLHGAVLKGSSSFLLPHLGSLGMEVCVELWYAPDSGRYRTQLHSQKCKKCGAFATAQVGLEDYVRKLTAVFQSFKNERLPEYTHQENEIWTDLHDSGRCHGCLKGVCPKGDKDVKDTRDAKEAKDNKA
ncbi:hypothetical protein BGZ82_007643 [Podila clonocystis]|nr:hypothetical protein BGZ82_007643 [Podila clonocystis]